MDFIYGVAKVLVGTFVLFTIARVSLNNLGSYHSGWPWVVFVGVLAVANMLLHRILGSSINPPFFTAVWFAITLAGLPPKESPTVLPLHKRAIFAIVVGTVVGCASYVDVVSTS